MLFSHMYISNVVAHMASSWYVIHTGACVDCVCDVYHLSYWGVIGLCLWCVTCHIGKWVDCVCEVCRYLRLCFVVVERQSEDAEARDWWSSWWHCNCFTWIPIILSVLCAVRLYILLSFCIVYVCSFCHVNYLIIDHMISMLAVSETGTKHKKLLKKSWMW